MQSDQSKLLSYKVGNFRLLNCNASQTLSPDQTKRGKIDLTVQAETTKKGDNPNHLLISVKVRLAGIDQEQSQEAFIIETTYQINATFENEENAGKALADRTFLEHLAQPLFHVATSRSYELMWEMGYPIRKKIHTIELFKEPKKKTRKKTITKKKD